MKTAIVTMLAAVSIAQNIPKSPTTWMECHPQYKLVCNQFELDLQMDRDPFENPYIGEEWYPGQLRNQRGSYHDEQIRIKAEKCVEALSLACDPQFIEQYFTNDWKDTVLCDDQFNCTRKEQRENRKRADEYEQDIEAGVECVRSMNAFETTHCEGEEGTVDPELCLQYQIGKLLEAERNAEEDLNPDFGTEKYLEKSAIWKKNKIWEKVIEDDTSMPFIWGEDIFDLFTNDMNLTFDHMHDIMPPGRQKLVHPEGVITKVAFIPQPNLPYTGMFKEAQHGIMRISDAKVTENGTLSSPSFGLKFLRDGIHAADAVTLVNFDGQNSYNFFKDRYKTHTIGLTDDCGRQTIGKKVAEATLHIGNMSVMDWGQYRQDGTQEEDPVWPFKLEFEGVNNYGWTDEYEEDYKEMFKKIQPGSVLFNVYGFESPIHTLVDTDGQLIGRIVTTSEVVSSLWGDQSLFFRHQRIDDDLELKPEWEDWLSPWPFGTLEENGLTRPMPFEPSSCPFAYLWDLLP